MLGLALVQRVEADAVGEFGGLINVPNREFRFFPDLQCSDLFSNAQSSGGLAGHSGKAFLRSHPKEGAGHVYAEQQRGQRRGAGIAVGGDGDGNPGLA